MEHVALSRQAVSSLTLRDASYWEADRRRTEWCVRVNAGSSRVTCPGIALVCGEEFR